MTDNKRVTNKQILDVLGELRMNDAELNALAIKIVSRMVKLKSMEDWFTHVSKSEIAWNVAYKDLELTEEEEALGEAAKLMTLMNMFKEDEEYEKCAIIKGRMEEVNRILRKNNKKLIHIDNVQRYVDDLYANIFNSALNGKINNNNNKLFKKYSRYLQLLKF